MFPRALEILLDFTFFDIDEGKHFTDNNHQRINSYAAILYYGISIHKIIGMKRSTGSTLSVLVAGLNRLSAEQDNARIDAFSTHLSKVNRILSHLMINVTSS
jgi:hypothetical protein